MTRRCRALFWQRPWTPKADASAARIRHALEDDRGVLLSACHLGAYYRLDRADRAKGSPTGAGPVVLPAAGPRLWGRRLARWQQGTRSHRSLRTGLFASSRRCSSGASRCSCSSISPVLGRRVSWANDDARRRHRPAGRTDRRAGPAAEGAPRRSRSVGRRRRGSRPESCTRRSRSCTPRSPCTARGWILEDRPRSRIRARRDGKTARRRRPGSRRRGIRSPPWPAARRSSRRGSRGSPERSR